MTSWRLGRWLADALPRPAKPDPAPRTTPPEVVWTDGAVAARRSCPNCGAEGDKREVLTVGFRALQHTARSWKLLDCAACGARFFVETGGLGHAQAADYGDDEMLSRGRASLYLQHGAGLAQIIRPIARLPKPHGSRMLDIGCGFGFGLDFAIRQRGWSGRGIDPAQIAGLGRDMLGIPIEQRLLAPDEPGMQGAFDVVMAAETIEHVPDPAAFLAILVSTLAPDGILVLTTPNGGAIGPDTAKDQLNGVLSPGLHVVLQSERSLRRLLTEAGLVHVEIAQDGAALVATASRVALPPACSDADAAALYSAYLMRRAADFTPEQDLYWGYHGRALLEAVNLGAWAQANTLRQAIAAACQRRFALSLDHPALFDETATCSLERMAALMPLNFGILLYADAMRALGQGGERAGQQRHFETAAEALRRLRRAIGDLGMADPLGEEIGWSAEAESLVCAASGPPDATLADRIKALAPAPNETGIGRRETMRLQAFVTAVNAASYENARALLKSLPELTLPREMQSRDVVFCRAMLELQPQGDAAQAIDGFAWLRAKLTKAGPPENIDMYWSALRGEAQALHRLDRDEEASALLEAARCAMASHTMTVPPDLAGPTRNDAA